MSLSSAHLVAFDLETTSSNPDEARIVTAAYVDIRPADPHGAAGSAYDVERWSRLVDPGVEIPAEAAEIHGITTDKARAEGHDAAESCEVIAGMLAGAWSSGAVIVGHNVVYDLTVVDRELRRHHGRSLEVGGHVVDTLCLDRAVDRYRKGKRTLEATAAHYKCALDGAHDSTEDALAAARIAWRIARAYPEIGAMPLDSLQTFQRDAYASWAENFEQYLRKVKKKDGEPQSVIDAVRIDRDWPLKPYLEARAA